MLAFVTSIPGKIVVSEEPVVTVALPLVVTTPETVVDALPLVRPVKEVPVVPV
jgi:hypothetical protein